MPLTSYTDIEVPANTVIYFTSEWIQTINMSVSYKPKILICITESLYITRVVETTGQIAQPEVVVVLKLFRENEVLLPLLSERK